MWLVRWARRRERVRNVRPSDPHPNLPPARGKEKDTLLRAGGGLGRGSKGYFFHVARGKESTRYGSQRCIMNATFIRQGLVIGKVSLTGIRARWWSSLNAMLGTAAVVGVLVVLLSIGEGYKSALQMTGSPDNVIFMRG